MLQAAVFFDGELLHHLGGAGNGHPGNVVARQVQQHHVLGSFLAIEQQCQRQALVGFVLGATLGGAGDRSNLDLAVGNAHARFGRRTKQRATFELEMERVGRRLTVGEPLEHLERIGAAFPGNRPRQHRLEHIAGRDVFSQLHDAIEEGLIGLLGNANTTGARSFGTVIRLLQCQERCCMTVLHCRHGFPWQATRDHLHHAAIFVIPNDIKAENQFDVGLVVRVRPPRPQRLEAIHEIEAKRAVDTNRDRRSLAIPHQPQQSAHWIENRRLAQHVAIARRGIRLWRD